MEKKKRKNAFEYMASQSGIKVISKDIPNPKLSGKPKPKEEKK